MTKHLRLALFAASLTAAALTTAAAHADTVSFTLTPVSATATPGSTLSFTATLIAPLTNSAPVYLNGDSLTFSGPQDISFTDLLFDNFPVAINPGETDTALLFTAFIPTLELPGPYTGFYALQGGTDGNSQGVLATDPFGINVTTAPAASVTPEPSSWLLLATGALGLMALSFRERFADSAAA